MTSGPQELGSGKNFAARLPEVDFAVVLSRVIESIDHDPAQLRNAVYELARIRLQREARRSYPPMEVRRLTLALESAIQGVETVYSRHDEMRALRSLHRLIESSEIRRSEMMTKPREPLLMVGQPAAQTAYGTRRITENRIAASSPNRGRATRSNGRHLRRGAVRSTQPIRPTPTASCCASTSWPAPTASGIVIALSARVCADGPALDCTDPRRSRKFLGSALRRCGGSGGRLCTFAHRTA